MPCPVQPPSSIQNYPPQSRRVLEQLERGYSNKAIAAALILSRRTVESHMSSLLAKTGCQSRTQLLLWALGER